MDTYTHLSLHDERAALEQLPRLPGVDGDYGNDTAIALGTGTDGLAVNEGEIAYKKLAKNPCLGSPRAALIGNDGTSTHLEDAEHSGADAENSNCDNCLPMKGLDNDSNHLSSTDKGKKEIWRRGRDSNPGKR